LKEEEKGIRNPKDYFPGLLIKCPIIADGAMALTP